MDDLQAGARWAPALRALGDERLAKMVEGGSDPAFAAIYGRYAPILHGYCRSLLRDEEEAGDALQNAMLKALQALRRAGRSGPLRPWLFRIAHNESVTIIRSRARRPGPLDDSLVAGAGDAFRRAAAREQLAALLEDMQQLTEHQRGALVMRELGGLTYDEIGSALETTPLAARQAVFAARKRLRDGVVSPRRLRPALRQLIPAPGFALFGLLGAGGGKALIGTAAVVSVGIGSVELAAQTPKPNHRPTAVAQATATPGPAKHHAAARAVHVVPSPTATPAAAARTPRTQRIVATVTPSRKVTRKTRIATHDTDTETEITLVSDDGDRSAPPSRPDQPAPTATQAPAPVPTASASPAATSAPVVYRPARPAAYGPPGDGAAPAAGGTGDQHSARRDCPPGQRPEPDGTDAPSGSVPPDPPVG